MTVFHAIRFNPSDYVNLGAVSAPEPSVGGTLMWWVRTTASLASLSSGGYRNLHRQWVNANQTISIGTSGGRVYAIRNNFSMQTSVLSGTDFVPNQWNLIVIRYNATGMKININALSAFSQSGSIIDGSTIADNVLMGQDNQASTDARDLDIAFPYVWNRYLTDGEVVSLRTQTPELAALATIVSGYRFKDGSYANEVSGGITAAAGNQFVFGSVPTPLTDGPNLDDLTTAPVVTSIGILRNAAIGSGLVIEKTDSITTHFKITDVTNGTLYLNDGVTVVPSNTFITYAQGVAGLKFVGNHNSCATGSFRAYSAINASGGSLSPTYAVGKIIITDPNWFANRTRLWMETAPSYSGRATDDLWRYHDTLPMIRVDLRTQSASEVRDYVKNFYRDLEDFWPEGKPREWTYEFIGPDGQNARTNFPAYATTHTDNTGGLVSNPSRLTGLPDLVSTWTVPSLGPQSGVVLTGHVSSPGGGAYDPTAISDFGAFRGDYPDETEYTCDFRVDIPCYVDNTSGTPDRFSVDVWVRVISVNSTASASVEIPAGSTFPTEALSVSIPEWAWDPTLPFDSRDVESGVEVTIAVRRMNNITGFGTVKMKAPTLRTFVYLHNVFPVISHPLDFSVIEVQKNRVSALYHTYANANVSSFYASHYSDVKDAIDNESDWPAGVSRTPKNVVLDDESIPDLPAHYYRSDGTTGLGQQAFAAWETRKNTELINGSQTAEQIKAAIEANMTIVLGRAPNEWDEGLGVNDPDQEKREVYGAVFAHSLSYCLKSNLGDTAKSSWSNVPFGNWNWGNIFTGSPDYPITLGPADHASYQGLLPSACRQDLAIFSSYGGPIYFRGGVLSNPKYPTLGNWQADPDFTVAPGSNDSETIIKLMSTVNPVICSDFKAAYPDVEFWTSVSIDGYEVVGINRLAELVAQALYETRLTGATGCWCFDPGYISSSTTRSYWHALASYYEQMEPEYDPDLFDSTGSSEGSSVGSSVSSSAGSSVNSSVNSSPNSSVNSSPLSSAGSSPNSSANSSPNSSPLSSAGSSSSPGSSAGSSPGSASSIGSSPGSSAGSSSSVGSSQLSSAASSANSSPLSSVGSSPLSSDNSSVNSSPNSSAGSSPGSSAGSSPNSSVGSSPDFSAGSSPQSSVGSSFLSSVGTSIQSSVNSSVDSSHLSSAESSEGSSFVSPESSVASSEDTQTGSEISHYDDGRYELYSILADRYASAQESVEDGTAEIYEAITQLVVRNTSQQAKEDCLSSIVQAYESLQMTSDKFVSPARRLSIHVLKISNLTDINDYLRLKKIKVRAAWALLSDLAGYPINAEFIGPYPKEFEPNENPSQGGSNVSVNPNPSDANIADPMWIGIQSWSYFGPHENYSSPLFTLPYVVPYVEAFFSFNDGDNRTMAERAQYVADRIAYERTFMELYHPGVPFQWAYWPHRYGYDGFTGSNDKLFYHAGDKLSNGYSSVFTEVGRTLFRNKMLEFFPLLKAALGAYGLPDPIFIDADYEGGTAGPMATNDWADRLTWHGLIMADPRAETELIDGVQTYAEFISSLTDLDGVPVPENELYSYIYDSSSTGVKRANVFSSFGNMIVDWGLHYTLYEPARITFPNVYCGNWGTFGSTREKLVHNYRFKESPVDVGANFHGIQVATLYGNSTTDTIGQPVGDGYNSYYEQLSRFGLTSPSVNTGGNLDAFARLIHTNYIEYFLAGMDLAKPSGDKAISLAWIGDGSWLGAQTYIDPAFFPAEYIGATLDYKAHPEIFDSIFQSCRNHKVRFMEIFAQDTNLSACNDMYNTFSTYYR